MISRQRVLAAIRNEPVDRVPIDLNPTLAAYERLKSQLGIEIDETVIPNNAMEVVPHPQVLAELGVDIISVKFPARCSDRAESDYRARPDDRWGVGAAATIPGTRTDSWGLHYRLIEQSAGVLYEVINHPLAGATMQDLETCPWPGPIGHDRVDALRESALRLYNETELALMGRFGAPIMDSGVCFP